MASEVIRQNLFHLQVCSDEGIDKALEYARINSPAGTSGNWNLQDDPKLAPVACQEAARPDHKHYIFQC